MRSNPEPTKSRSAPDFSSVFPGKQRRCRPCEKFPLEDGNLLHQTPESKEHLNHQRQQLRRHHWLFVRCLAQCHYSALDHQAQTESLRSRKKFIVSDFAYSPLISPSVFCCALRIAGGLTARSNRETLPATGHPKLPPQYPALARSVHHPRHAAVVDLFVFGAFAQIPPLVVLKQ